MIRVVDYGLGNVQAFLNVYKRLGIPAQRAAVAADLDGARHVILPGVGSFDYAMERFSASGMRERLERLVADGDTRILGICVGMQMLADSSDEGALPGLGWIPGKVKQFQDDALPMPHMGWNDVVPAQSTGLLEEADAGLRFYFLHSYYFACTDPSNAIAHARYGISFDCAVRRGQVFGVQFHPEKSHGWGGALLRNFASI